ncbi:MAG TPA: hypothetical protein VK705_01060 [Ferruginibacter sp.]|nr:hypothetical protein [Ferruginibacter sp.]
MNKGVAHILLLLFTISGIVNAQPSPAGQSITIKGKAVSAKGLGGLYQVIVINQRTSEGLLADPNGNFKVISLKNDTILVSASGYGVRKICFHDSMDRTVYNVTIRLDSIHYSLAEVKIYPTKTLRDVNKERNALGEIPNTDINPDANPIFNPISYLYERFSRLERSKRKVAQLEDDEKRREVLKDLFHIYIRHDIIDLSDAEFEKFLDYCNFPDDFIKNSTDYDLVMAIKYRYEQFEKMHDYVSPFSKQ